jgi:hypothetical protein
MTAFERARLQIAMAVGSACVLELVTGHANAAVVSALAVTYAALRR